MRKYITLFFSVTVILSACKGDKAPEGTISLPRMVNLMTDVITIDGRLYYYGQNQDSLYKYGTGKYMAVFKRYHTDSVHFTRSLKYYAAQPDKLQGIFDQVLAGLKQKTDSLNKLQTGHVHAIPQK